ncbi:hypothetical protein B0A52_05093 [Exophiala mesophila]|uniref:Xylanolytic transcriptional activator regulatory domain-containing protein n=1 Tax=Exophiala mesophila TaxID=212818 RepID=A0A438N6X5_EXOME|nr:hypothetical protein B0A52_05093 [Exophiala mesophila]
MTNVAPDLSVLAGFSFDKSLASVDSNLSNDESTGSTTSLDGSGDLLLDLYYKYFQRLHPFVLPQRHLSRLLADPANYEKLKPLIAMMKFIGSLYAECENCRELKAVASALRSERQKSSLKPDGFLVQCHLLSSMALYWFGEESESREEMANAINLALQLGMHDRHFAAANCYGDAVLQESWRRTWWTIYVIDAFYAAMTHVTTFPTCNIEATTELPCEEEDYESGIIPFPMTLDDFNSREFAAECHVYSSFAYLIGATHGVSSAISKGSSEFSERSSQMVLAEVDAVVDGWLLLLPDSKRQIISKSGEVDELMYQAHMAIHAAMVGAHRRFSELYFDPVETVSGCTPTPPECKSRYRVEYENIHTRRCLKAIEGQVQLMAVPTRPWLHSPFVACMVVTGTISLLSACRFYFTGRRLTIARAQIRMTIGYLKSLAQVWPRAQQSMQEVQVIAREVLMLSGKDGHSSSQLRITNQCGPTFLESSMDQHRSVRGESIPGMDGFQSLFDFGDFCADTSWLSGS